MKKRIILTLVIVSLFVCLFAISANAEIIKYNGTTMQFDLKSDGTATFITANRTECTEKEIIIPATIEHGGRTYTVTALADRSIGYQNSTDSNQYVEYIYVPSTVTSFGPQLFRNCPKLKKIKIDASLTTIAGHIMAGNTNLEEVDLSGMTNLTTIEGYAAQGCSKLTTVKLPNTVKTIGDKAFQDCAVTNITFPNGLISIGSNCFQNADFAKVVIPQSVTTLSGAAFHMTYNLKTVVFANSDISGYRSDNSLAYVTLVFYAGENADTVKNQFSQFKNFTAVSYENYLKNPNAKYEKTIVYGTTNCSSCGDVVTGEKSFLFTDFISEMKDAVVCSCGKTDVIRTYDPIITLTGYSAKIGGDKICVGYTIDEESATVYKEKTEKSLKFAITAAIAPEGAAQYETAGDNLTAINGSLVVEIENGYSGFDFILSGFTTEYYALPLVMGACVWNGSDVYYVNFVGGKYSCDTYAIPFTFDTVAA